MGWFIVLRGKRPPPRNDKLAAEGTEQMLSAHDWYNKSAALVGALDKLPTDRPMDGVDTSRFLLGESRASGRETIVSFGPDGSLMSFKWRQVKAVFRCCRGTSEPIVEAQFPMFFDLGSDPNERWNLFNTKLNMGWMFGVAHHALLDEKQRTTDCLENRSRVPHREPG